MKIHLAACDSEITDRCIAIASKVQGCEIVGISHDPFEVRRLVEAGSVDLVVHSSMSLRTLLGVAQVLGECKACGDPPRSVIIARNIDRAYVYGALALGADDVIEFHQDDESLTSAVMASTLTGQRSCQRFLVGNVEPAPALSAVSIADLRGVDLKIVRLVSMGYADREIAGLLNFSHQTIRNKISRLLEANGLRNRTQLGMAYIFFRMSQLDTAAGAA